MLISIAVHWVCHGITSLRTEWMNLQLLGIA